MFVTVATPPEPVASAEEALAHLRVDDEDEATQVEGFVAAATAMLEAELRRAIGRQTLVCHLDAWPAQRLALPRPPAVTVVEVTFVDAAGETQTVDPMIYRLAAGGVLVTRPGKAWPVALEEISIKYLAGYDPVPADLKLAVLMLAAELYANRGEAIRSDLVQSPLIQRLLQPFRLVRV